MRQFIASFCLSLFLLPLFQAARAQSLQDPCHWTYTVQKTGTNEYQLKFSLKLDKGWHIWSMHVGGDGSQIVPLFSFNPNKAIQLVGQIQEKGALHTEQMEGIDGKVNFYSEQVTYTQTVKAKAGTTITGTHTFQVCNDMMCLPPKDQKFSFTLN